MADRSLADIAARIGEIDIAILSTKTEGGAVAGRPMSNNAQVDYDGDSYYFTMDDTRTVGDIARDPQVGLGFQGDDGFYVSVEGRGSIVRDKAAFEAHWSPDLDKWFADGIDTPGLVMVKVSAERIHYWDGRDEGEIKL